MTDEEKEFFTRTIVAAMADHQATVMPEAHHKHHEFIGAHHGVVLRVAP